MTRISATSSLGIKVSLGHKKGFGQYDNASPHHSFTIEREIEDGLSDEELAAKADELHAIVKKLAEEKINQDLRELKSKDD